MRSAGRSWRPRRTPSRARRTATRPPRTATTSARRTARPRPWRSPSRATTSRPRTQELQQPSYEEPYFNGNNGFPQTDGFQATGSEYPSTNGGYPAPNGNGGYPEPTYTEPVQEEPAPVHASAPESFSAFEERRYQDDWPQPDGYQNGHSSEYAPETESAQAADVSERNHVGFERPGPAPSAAHALTDAGLPRRGSTTSGTSSQQRHLPAARGPGDTGTHSRPRGAERQRERRTEPVPTTGARPTTSAGSGPNSSASPRRAGSPPPACRGGYPRPTWSRVPRKRPRRAAHRSPAPPRTSGAG